MTQTTVAPQTDTLHVRERIRSQLTALTVAERRVADAILRDPMGVIHLSVSELASIAQTSAATVVRLCTSIGLRGYQDLKITLASESIPDDRRVLGEIADDDGVAEIAHKTMDGSARAVALAAKALDISSVERTIDALSSAPRVQLGAVGTSAPLALDMAYRLTQLGIDATFAADVHTQHVAARMLRPGDLFFAISHTGSTFETLATTRAAVEAGAMTIALTSFTHSPLTELVDLSLVAGSAETAYRVEAMASRIVHLAVLDVLFVSLSLRNPSASKHLAMTEDVLIEHRP